MKQVKFLLAIALVSVIAVSCKETPKEEVVEPVEEVVVEEVAVDTVAVDSVAVEAPEVQ